MSIFRTEKIVSSLPVTLDPDTLYLIRVGDGFDLYCSDTTGSIAHQINGIQPGDLSTVATSGAYSDLSGLPTLGTAAATASTDYATAAQGTLANTAVQPAGITNFETTTQLNARDTNNRARTNHTGTQLAATISDFQSTVSANTDVAANTSARHVAVTVVDSSEIDFTLTGQQITASLINTAVTPATYGSASTVSSFTVDAKGRITAASNTTIALPATAISDFTAASQAVIDNTAFVFEGGDSSTNFYPITLDMGASA